MSSYREQKRSFQGFTLIELLIVVAIIAILAAIAVPNFLEAQVRSKVARVKADFRSLATGIESYAVDSRSYPWRPGYTSQYNEISLRLADLTTPIAYMTNVDMKDPFISTGTQGGYTDKLMRYQYNYRNYQYDNGGVAAIKNLHAWALNSVGPDHLKNQGLKIESFARGLTTDTVIYDPTNGTTSAGDIPWTGGDTKYANK